MSKTNMSEEFFAALSMRFRGVHQRCQWHWADEVVFTVDTRSYQTANTDDAAVAVHCSRCKNWVLSTRAIVDQNMTHRSL